MRNVSCIKGLPFVVNEFIDIVDTLPCRTPDVETPRLPEQIKRISVHHSGVEGGTIKGYADYHVNILKWCHIGYHVVVKTDQVFQTNSLLTFSYHTSKQNHDTVSVSVSGDLTKRPLSEVERNNLYAVILTYMELFNIPASEVLGHNEFPGNESTACPGIDMSRVRNDITKIKTQMEYAKSRNAQEAMAYNIAQTILWTYNTAKGLDQYGKPTVDEGGKEWARQRLLLLEPAMREHGFLQ
jgi:hypothetical protein